MLKTTIFFDPMNGIRPSRRYFPGPSATIAWPLWITTAAVPASTIIGHTGTIEGPTGLGLWANGDTSQPGLALGLAVAATFGAMLSMASKDRIALLGLTPAPERALGWLLGGRDGRLLLITIGALFGSPMLTLGVVAATSMLSLLLRVYFVRRLVRTPASPGRPV